MKALKLTILPALFLLLSSQSFSQYVYNWFPVPSGTSNTLNHVLAKWISGNGGKLLTTTNSGNNWSAVTLPVTSDLYSAAVSSNGSTIIVTGAGGRIVRSTDNGLSWQEQISNTTVNLNSVTRTVPNGYAAVGDGGTVLYSTSSGVLWQQQLSMTTSKLNAVFGLGLNLWAVGNGGTIITTSNSGTNWVVRSSGVTDDLKSVVFANLTTGWAVGNNGRILNTTDGGVNWMQQSSGTTQNLNSVTVLNTTLGAAGNNNVVLRSTNYGANWLPLSGTGLPNFNIRSAVIYSLEEFLVTGDNGNIYKRRIDQLYLPYAALEGNDIRAFFTHKGIFNQDIRTTNTPGFEWLRNTGKFAIFTSGLTIGANVNNSIRLAAASYNGEYKSGYVLNGSFATDARFRIYKVKRGDTYLTNQNWNEWGNMVPFGAPFTDVNNNGTFEPQVDIPGVKDALKLSLCV